MGALYRGPKRGYEMTTYDRNVLAVSMNGEAGGNLSQTEAAAVAWALMYRFHLVDARWSQEGWPFALFIQKFSQPVNPDWADPDSSKCQKYPNLCTPELISKRRNNLSYLDGDQWISIQANMGRAAKYAQEFYDGILPTPFLEPVYDFASCSRVAKQGRPGTGLDIGKNCFLTYRDLKVSERESVIAGTVTTGVTAHLSAIGYAVIGLVGAVAAYVWESRK